MTIPLGKVSLKFRNSSLTNIFIRFFWTTNIQDCTFSNIEAAWTQTSMICHLIPNREHPVSAICKKICSVSVLFGCDLICCKFHSASYTFNISIFKGNKALTKFMSAYYNHLHRNGFYDRKHFAKAGYSFLFSFSKSHTDIFFHPHRVVLHSNFIYIISL